ncbi:hypothetical protein [Yinghuangia sp. YIM S10712]
MARRAVRARMGPERVSAVAYAIARWWEQALCWEDEEIWPY